MDVVFVKATRKKTCQMQYEVLWVAISHYYHNVLGQKMTKKEAKKEKLTLTRQQYFDVSIPYFRMRHLR